MFITYRDKLGYVLVKVDEHGISILDGEAYFSDGIREYRIPINDLCEIQSYQGGSVMGYYTYHTMSAKAKTLTPELVEEINKWLEERQVIGYALDDGEITTDWRNIPFVEWEPYGESKWYEHNEDMEALSKAFPDVTFCLHGDGEEKHDEWDEYWLNGECERCQAQVHIPEPTKIKW